MKIQKIEIINYKAFYDTHEIVVGCKNLFIYGENGSGKSSLYYAIKDFFQSSIEDIDLNELENIFVAEEKQGKTSIKVTFKPNSQGHNRSKSYKFDNSRNDTRDAKDTSIRDGNKLKSFLTYRHLLAIHYLKNEVSINLFDLLVKGVLKHFRYSLTGGKELGELWADVKDGISRKTDKEYPINKKKADVNAAVKIFNEAFGELFKPESPEYILKHARPILEYFNHNIDLNLHFQQIRPSENYDAIGGAQVNIDLTFAGKPVKKPHLFLNEARLSAIAISIYLGLIKRHIQGIPCKILFLDDIFIGLDISNRLPLLDILEFEFPEYQIFITTYDKPWFEYARSALEHKSGWKTMEFYAQQMDNGMEMPVIFDNQDMITKAERYLHHCDYKAAAIYTRTAFEKNLRKYCERKKKPVVYKSQPKKYTTEDFWNAIKADVPEATKNNIEGYRSLVLNPLCHYNTERHEIKTELTNAIASVKTLKTELSRV